MCCVRLARPIVLMCLFICLLLSDSIILCSPCSMIFPSKFALLEHNLTAHNTSKIFACPDCLKCFPDAETRRIHHQAEHMVPAAVLNMCAANKDMAQSSQN
ncbi:putative zinc finger protein [Fasciola hepatica]|uniref:Zinc finger protein n=1 Tax=Fasciola hepatica TaxID=6192 RepID=A0A4E0QWR7_FASHE|nr:putative zinc finger protein [Fasciola hepatica]